MRQEGSLRIQNVRCSGYAMPSAVPTVVIFICSVLCCISCGSHRKMAKEETLKTRAVQTAQLIRVESHEKIPEARAEIALPIEKIQALPQGLDFQHREGRAQATIRVERDTIFFSAHCDSLQRLVERYEEIIAQQDFRDHQETVVHQKRKWGWPRGVLAVLLLAFIVGVLHVRE